MTEDKNDKGDAPTKADLDTLRSQLDKKVSAAQKRASEAEGRASAAEAKVVNDNFKINIPEASEEGISEEQRTELTGALKQGQEAQRNLATLIPKYLEQQAKALAFEVAVDSNATDDMDDILDRLSAIKSPNDMDALAKEIKLEYREAKIKDTADGKKGDKESKDDDTSGRKFDEGGGQGGINESSAVKKKIDEVKITTQSSADDINKAQQDLDSVYEQATKAQ